MNQDTTVHIRRASGDDAPAITGLISELAHSIGEASPMSDHYARIYLASQSCGVLLAEIEGATVGLLSYSIRPNLYHAGPCALIEELVVRASRRGQGIGTALLREAICLFESMGCAEASVSTLPDNQGAQRLYRNLGFTDEGVLLEKHFGAP